MKTKELIRQLQEADPSGEVEVVVKNLDISFVSKEPAYYDGPAQILIRDEKGRGIGGKYCRQGDKVQVHTVKFYEILWDRDFPIDYSELDEERKKSYQEDHVKIRKKGQDCDYQLELENFCDWARERGAIAAKEFFETNKLTPYDDIPADIPFINESYVSRRWLQWDRQYEVVDSQIIKKEKKDATR